MRRAPVEFLVWQSKHKQTNPKSPNNSKKGQMGGLQIHQTLLNQLADWACLWDSSLVMLRILQSAPMVTGACEAEAGALFEPSSPRPA